MDRLTIATGRRDSSSLPSKLRPSGSGNRRVSKYPRETNIASTRGGSTPSRLGSPSISIERVAQLLLAGSALATPTRETPGSSAHRGSPPRARGPRVRPERGPAGDDPRHLRRHVLAHGTHGEGHEGDRKGDGGHRGHEPLGKELGHDPRPARAEGEA